MRKTFLLSVLIITLTNCDFQKHKSLSEEDSIGYKNLKANLKIISESDNITKANLPIQLDRNWIHFDKKDIKLYIPNSENPYPISYSFIYGNRLIALSDNGHFSCFKLDNFKNDTSFEEKLNSSNKKFEYALLIENQIIVLEKGRYFVYDEEKGWINYDKDIPFEKSPKLFEDENYLVFSACKGEWGGTIFFYDKKTKRITCTNGTCANSIVKTDSSYLITYSLAHMFGHSYIVNLKNPAELPILIEKVKSKDEWGFNQMVSQGFYQDSLRKISQNDSLNLKDNGYIFFNQSSILIFASFFWNGEYLHFINYKRMTFLAKIENNKISVVNSLWNDDSFVHDAVTTNYSKNCILVNKIKSIKGYDKEGSLWLFKENQLLRITWVKK